MKAEQTLWDEARAGDGESFAQVFDRHKDRVFRHVLRLVDTVGDAEDIVAVSFMELWRRRDDVRVVNGSVLPWLLVTATHSARNVQRSSRRYRALLDRLPREQHAPDAATTYFEGAWDGVDADLASQLRGLPWADQQLVTLYALEGFTLAETAETLGISLAAVKSRLHRLRQRLQPRVTGTTRKATT